MSLKSKAIHVEQLRKKGLKVKLKELYPERIQKTEAEIKEVLKVRNATEKAMRHCLNIIRSSTEKQKLLFWKGKKLTSELLKTEARKLLLEAACEAPSIIISHGPQTAEPHTEGTGQLKAGEPILLDFFPRSLESGYWFDMTRTIIKGKPSKELEQLWNTVKKAQAAALKAVKPGIQTKKLHMIAEEVFKKAGYGTGKEGFIHSLGHGLGLNIHEQPSVGPRSSTKLKPGMLITIEPGLYYKRVGGVRLEDTILVTKTGCKNLTRVPKTIR